ncbi:MAG: UxaA family hydrolase [Deltaproteobacteria bacterium]|nr:UxaA family hydrolase [Deltaproteobacteria bacterium]
MKKRGLVLHGSDNVVTVLEDVHQGDVVACGGAPEASEVEAREAIPFGFKMALREIGPGEPVRKYGYPIGRAVKRVPRGALVHVHNLEGSRGRGDLRGEP